LLKSLFVQKQNSILLKILTLATIFFTLASIIALNRYYSFYATYDHGLFNQLFWNSIHGRLFQGSLSSGNSSAVIFDGKIPSLSYNHLGQHFVLDFLLWLPLYALFPSPVTLLVLQVGLITAAGLVLYVLSRQYLAPTLSVFITASYYGANSIIGPSLHDFYESCQIPLFAFGLLLALEKRCWWLFWLLAALTLGVREDAGIMLFGIGIYLVLSRRYPYSGLILCLLSFCYIVVVTNILMPMFSNDNSRLYLTTYFGQFTKSQHPTTLELLWGIISQPQVVLSVFCNHLDRCLRYMLGLWQPLAFISAISPSTWIITSLPLFENLIQNSQNANATSLNYHSTLPLAPGLYYGAILWWSQHQQKFNRRLRRFWLACIVVSLVFTVASDPHRSLYFLVPSSLKPFVYVSLSDRWQHAAHVQTAIQLIPQKASVAASEEPLSHLSSRQAIVQLPSLQFRDEQQRVRDVDYVLLDLWKFRRHLTSPAARHRLKKRHLTSPAARHRLKITMLRLDRALQQGRYKIIAWQDDVLLLQKGSVTAPEALVFWSSLQDELRSIGQGGLSNGCVDQTCRR